MGGSFSLSLLRPIRSHSSRSALIRPPSLRRSLSYALPPAVEFFAEGIVERFRLELSDFRSFSGHTVDCIPVRTPHVALLDERWLSCALQFCSRFLAQRAVAAFFAIS